MSLGGVYPRGLSFFWKSEGAIGGETYKGGTGKRVWGCDADVKWTKKKVTGKKTKWNSQNSQEFWALGDLQEQIDTGSCRHRHN